MAIPQDEYIHIVSSNVGDSEAAERDLSGLVFTDNSSMNGSDGSADSTWRDWVKSSPLVTRDFYSDTEVGKAFGSTSREYQFAQDYFAYISPSGTTPRKLTFCRISSTWDATWTPAAIIDKIDEQDTNFGSFCFLQSEKMNAGHVKDVFTTIKGKNYKYLFSLAVPRYALLTDTLIPTENVASVSDSTLLSACSAKSLIEYLFEGENPTISRDSGNGTFFIASSTDTDKDESDDTWYESSGDNYIYKDNRVYCASFMPMALFASTDYNALNSTKNFMFKDFGDVYPAITTKADKTTYDNLNINYVGLVQNYGRKRMFLQQGFNLDGEDAAVYCNEIWLKSHISTQLFDLMLTMEKIEANETGELLIYNTICSCAELGKTNGTIEVVKRLTDAQKRTIYRLTNSDTAWETIYQSGYWLNVEIRPKELENRTEYWAYYDLVYAKGDSVRKVEGRDFLV